MNRFIRFVLLFTYGCGQTAPANTCATPSRVVSCDEQNFYTFEVTGQDGAQPTWLGSQCRARACATGDACEARIDGTFVEGVCR